MTYRFQLTNEDTTPVRLDLAITGWMDGFSRSQLIQAIRDGFISVNDRTEVKPALKLLCGDIVRFDFEAYTNKLNPSQPPKMPPILYEDEHVAVIDKPANVVVHEGHGHVGDTLAETFKAHWRNIREVGMEGRNGIVHRLDKDTSGLMLVALSQQAYERLSQDLKARTIKRTYVALVRGHLSPAAGVIDAPLTRSNKNPLKRMVSPDGKPARTVYETTTLFSDKSLLKLTLESGRTHQIRVHLASINHPICGDLLYGGQALKGLSRQFLHATVIQFCHPVSGDSMKFSSTLPPELQSTLSGML